MRGTRTCPRSIYGAPCDPIFDFAARRAPCRRCGNDLEVDWLPGCWRPHRYDARVTFWVNDVPGERRVLIDDLGASQGGDWPWIVVQDQAGNWLVLEEVRELNPDQAYPFEMDPPGPTNQ